MDSAQNALNTAEASAKGAELGGKIIAFAVSELPQASPALLGNSALTAAIGLWGQSGMTKSQVAGLLRKMAEHMERGDFAAPAAR